VLRGWVDTSAAASWWSAVAPGPPARPSQSLVLVRSAARRGTITGIWSWRGSVRSADFDGDVVTVHRVDGSAHRHRPIGDDWAIDLAAGATSAVVLGRGMAAESSDRSTTERGSDAPTARARALSLPFRTILGAAHYRRSEQSWEEAGKPTCVVSIERSGERLVVRVDVPRAERRFAPIEAENPFDNDPAAIHGDGVQLYVAAGEHASGWLLVPIPGSTEVARRRADGWSGTLPIEASWQPSADGYSLVASVALPTGGAEADVDVLVNEIAPGRSRRRGQLVLSGAHGEFVYLRADRHDRERLLRFALGDR